ncbi:MAG: MFS transporter [Microlunatus sp.]|nr:MFS transporter [Microlunatus sp.]
MEYLALVHLRASQRRALLPLGAVVVLLGLADSMTGSYLVLFATNQAGLVPLQLGLLSSAIALGGIVTSAFLGRRFDRTPSRIFLIIVGVGGGIGYLLMPQTSDFVILLILGLTLVGIVGAGYPQAFALAAAVLPEDTRQRATPVLRSGWSLAWAIGPMAGAGLLVAHGYAGLFRASAIALLLTAAVVVIIVPPPRNITPDSDRVNGTDSGTAVASRWMIVSITAGMVLVHCAMFAGSIALPLLVTQDLGRPQTDVGLLFSACAVVEIMAALALVWLLPRTSLSLLILIGFALFVAYFILTVLAGSTTVLLLAQLARGSAIAVVGTAGIQYFQSLGTIGAMTALFSNAGAAGSLISGILAGGLVQWLGTTGALGCCALLSVAGGLLFCIGHRIRTAQAGQDAPADPTDPPGRRSAQSFTPAVTGNACRSGTGIEH